jgi:hypothetical protein
MDPPFSGKNEFAKKVIHYRKFRAKLWANGVLDNVTFRPRSSRRPLGLDDGPRKAVTQHHEGLKLESALAILSWQRLMEQVLSRRVMRPQACSRLVNRLLRCSHYPQAGKTRPGATRCPI